jgi:hypothetical protein
MFTLRLEVDSVRGVRLAVGEQGVWRRRRPTTYVVGPRFIILLASQLITRNY